VKSADTRRGIRVQSLFSIGILIALEGFSTGCLPVATQYWHQGFYLSPVRRKALVNVWIAVVIAGFVGFFLGWYIERIARALQRISAYAERFR
jgi:hypothetical protein